MTMPRFTAEAGLYQTSGHYRTSEHMVASSRQMIGTIHLAEIEVPPEVIVITEELPEGPWFPPTWGGHTAPSGTPGPFEGGEGMGKGPVKGTGKDKPAPKRPVRRPVQLGRQCNGKEAGPDLAQAELDCAAKAKPGGLLRTLQCFDNPDGSVEPVCCHMDAKGNIRLCISNIEQVPTG